MNRFTARGAMAALTGALTATLLAAPALATTPAGGTADPEDAGSTGKLVLLMDSSGSMNDPDSAYKALMCFLSDDPQAAGQHGAAHQPALVGVEQGACGPHTLLGGGHAAA